MTTIQEAFAQTSLYAVSYKPVASLGLTWFKTQNLSEVLTIEGKFARRTALPCGKRAVVNITVFGEKQFRNHQ